MGFLECWPCQGLLMYIFQIWFNILGMVVGWLVERSQTDVQIVSNLPAASNGGPIYRFLGKPDMRARWMIGAAPHKRG